MDEGEKQRRRRTPFDQASDVASRLILFLGQRTFLSPLAGLGPIVLTVFGVIFLFAFLIILTGGGLGPGGLGPGGSPSPTPTPAPIAGTPPGETPRSTPPPSSGSLREDILREFGIDMIGFDDERLRWTREKFWDMASTKFIVLAQGSTVVSVGGTSSRQIGCFSSTSIQLGNYSSKPLFTFILIHEFGHVIRNCHRREGIQWTQHIESFTREGAISYYASNARACTGSDNLSEDYADMTAYYLNREAGLASAPCGPQNPPNPYIANGFPLHYTIANGVLGSY